MADIRQSLVEFLKADAGVSALAGTRVYPEAAPMQPSAAYFPRVVFSQSTKDMPRGLGGSSRQPVTQLRIECQAWGATGYAQAAALAKAVRDATGGVAGGPRLEDFGPGFMGTASRVWVKHVRFEGDGSDPPEQAPGGEQKRVHTAALEAVIHWNETTFS